MFCGERSTSMRVWDHVNKVFLLLCLFFFFCPPPPPPPPPPSRLATCSGCADAALGTKSVHFTFRRTSLTSPSLFLHLSVFGFLGALAFLIFEALAFLSRRERFYSSKLGQMWS